MRSIAVSQGDLAGEFGFVMRLRFADRVEDETPRCPTDWPEILHDEYVQVGV